MPKLIPDLDRRIERAARRMLMEGGYQGLSMRGLAQECGVAPGTLYHYVAGKDELVAKVTLADWQACVAQMGLFAADPHSLAGGLMGLAQILADFTERYRHIWASYDGNAAGAYTARFHTALRAQIAGPLERVMQSTGREDLVPAAPALAETLLACALNADLGARALEPLVAALGG